jgi:hypothetical protein
MTSLIKQANSGALPLAAAWLVVFSFALPTSLARAEEDVPDAVTKLCMSEEAEGGYDWNWQGMKARIYIVCQGRSNIVAAITSLDSIGSFRLGLVHTAIQDERLQFTTYDATSDGVKLVDGRNPSHAVLELSIPGLSEGRAIGTYTPSNNIPAKVNAQRTKRLPHLLPQDDLASNFGGQFPGTYLIEKPSNATIKRDFERVGIVLPAYLTFQIVNGIQMATFHDSGHFRNFLVFGMSAKKAGNVFYIANGVDDGSAGRDTVTQVRGRFRTPDAIEFFYFNSFTGLVGLIRATRLDDEALEKLRAAQARRLEPFPDKPTHDKARPALLSKRPARKTSSPTALR